MGANASVTADLEAPAPAELPASACEGYIDFVGPRRTFGWAWCREFPETAVDVEIRIDDRPVVTVRADKFRQDLVRARVGNGHHGFDVALPEVVGAEEKHRVSAYVLTAPGRPSVPLINRAAVKAPARPASEAGGSPVALVGNGQQGATCSSQLREVLSRVMAGQKTVEASLTAMAAEVRQLAASGAGVDARAEAALSKAVDQLHAVQDMLARQSAATELLQTRLDSLIAALGDRDGLAPQGGGSDRALYLSVGVLALISVAALAFGIYSLLV